MSVLGIVSEYNPFHNGHKYHLEQSKAVCNTDSVICVMSGNFIQRGEPAIVDKWARAEMALTSGVDLVIELPVVYAMASAEFFAYGAVKILDSIGITDYICFGSEAGSLDKLSLVADILNAEPHEYKASLRDFLAEGLSFPAARENALFKYLSASGVHTDDFGDMIKSSNNILAIEYIKALKKIGSRIQPQTVKRIANTYNSPDLQGPISSATAIRRHLWSLEGFGQANDPAQGSKPQAFTDSMASAMPSQCLDILQRELNAGRGPVFSKHFENTVLSALRRMSAGEISGLPYIAEGLENRIKSAAGNSGSLEQLIENIGTRRYAKTRIQRSIFNLLTGLKGWELEDFNKAGGPQYIRVLGFNQKGRRLLSEINKSAVLPVIVKAADFKNSPNPRLARMLEIESASTDQYVLGYSNPQNKKSGQEFTRNIVCFC